MARSTSASVPAAKGSASNNCPDEMDSDLYAKIRVAFDGNDKVVVTVATGLSKNGINTMALALRKDFRDERIYEKLGLNMGQGEALYAALHPETDTSTPGNDDKSARGGSSRRSGERGGSNVQRIMVDNPDPATWTYSRKLQEWNDGNRDPDLLSALLIDATLNRTGVALIVADGDGEDEIDFEITGEYISDVARGAAPIAPGQYYGDSLIVSIAEALGQVVEFDPSIRSTAQQVRLIRGANTTSRAKWKPVSPSVRGLVRWAADGRIELEPGRKIATALAGFKTPQDVRDRGPADWRDIASQYITACKRDGGLAGRLEEALYQKGTPSTSSTSTSSSSGGLEQRGTPAQPNALGRDDRQLPGATQAPTPIHLIEGAFRALALQHGVSVETCRLDMGSMRLTFTGSVNAR